MSQPRLEVVPSSLKAANAYVAEHHRHHPPARGCKFAIAVIDEAGEVRGVAIVGRPVSRMRDDGRTAEVTRLATDGCPNACSALYAAAWRACRAMGYQRLGTYTLVTEPGTSLRAAGWALIGHTKPENWDRPGRARNADAHPATAKQLWQVGA